MKSPIDELIIDLTEDWSLISRISMFFFKFPNLDVALTSKLLDKILFVCCIPLKDDIDKVKVWLNENWLFNPIEL